MGGASGEIIETPGELKGFRNPPDILFEGQESPQSTQAVLDVIKLPGDLEHAGPDLLHFRGYRSATGIEQYDGARRHQAHAQGRVHANTASQCVFHPSPTLADQRQTKPESYGTGDDCRTHHAVPVRRECPTERPAAT